MEADLKYRIEAIIQSEFLLENIHGVILIGSAYLHCYKSAEQWPKPRDVDIVIVTDGAQFERENIQKDGLEFDIHSYSFEKIMGLVHRRKDLLWIRNFFAAEYFYKPGSMLAIFQEMIHKLRQSGPTDFLPFRDRESDRLVAQNYRGKLKTHVAEPFTSTAYLQQLIQLNYSWLCRDQGLWPSADTRAIARDIKERFPHLHRIVEDYFGSQCSAKRLQCVDKINFV